MDGCECYFFVTFTRKLLRKGQDLTYMLFGMIVAANTNKGTVLFSTKKLLFSAFQVQKFQAKQHFFCRNSCKD